MSAAFTPEPDDRDRDDARPVPSRTPSGDGRLTERDKRILDDIAGHETGSDPKFAARLSDRSRPASRATERAVQILAVVAVVIVLLPGQWRLTAIMIGLFLVGPAIVAWYGYRAGQNTPGQNGTGSGTPPTGPF